MRRLLTYFGFLIATPIWANPIATMTLSNGLQVWVKPDQRAPVAVFSIWYQVGSADEKAGVTGISHMLEHMMFRGTSQVPDGHFSQLIAARGGSQNAMTTADYTGYYQVMGKQYLPLSFRLEADRMQNLLLRQSAFDKERQVVEEERLTRIDDSPMALLNEHVSAATWLNNPYRNPVIGWQSDIAQYQLDDLWQWYQQWYHPNNAVIVVVGDVTPKAVFDLAKQYFGKIPAGDMPTRKTYPLLKSLGLRQVAVCTPTQWQGLILGFNVPSLLTPHQAQDAYVLTVIANLLSGGSSSRFRDQLIVKQQVAAGIDVSYQPLSRYATAFKIMAIPAKGITLTTLQQAIMKQLKRLQTTQVDQTELKRVHQLMQADYWFSKDSLLSQARFLGSIAMHQQPPALYQDYLQHLFAVTPVQIQAVAQRYLNSSNSTQGTLQPCAQGAAS